MREQLELPLYLPQLPAQQNAGRPEARERAEALAWFKAATVAELVAIAHEHAGAGT